MYRCDSVLRAEKVKMAYKFGQIFFFGVFFLVVAIVVSRGQMIELSAAVTSVIVICEFTFSTIAVFLFIYGIILTDNKEKKYFMIGYALMIIGLNLLIILHFTKPHGILLDVIMIIAILSFISSVIYLIIASEIFEKGKKKKIIKLHNMGYQLPEILKETDQNEEATNRYIKEYERVKKLNKQMMSVKEISHTLVMRKSLVMEYVKLIDEKS